MSAMWRTFLLCLSIGLSGSFLVSSDVAHASDLEQHLRDEYQGKTLVLRGFYSDDKLHFDATGVPTGKPRHGDWTSDGFVAVSDIQISSRRLRIEAQREIAVWTEANKSFQLRQLVVAGFPRKGPILLKIEADMLSENPSATEVDEAIAKIFLTAKDTFADQIPAYWKPCILAEFGGKEGNCHFSPEMLNIPGLSQSSDYLASSTASQEPKGMFIKRLEKGVTPPVALQKPDPPFTERARQARIQGSLLLSLVVDKEGRPERVQILRPLGCGLDDIAVQTVTGWRFAPARKDGENVPVEIAVEIDFHLY